jgi:hypothetical protein
MKIRQALRDHLPWFIIVICIMQAMFALLLQHSNEAFAWIIAAIGWIAYRIET